MLRHQSNSENPELLPAFLTSIAVLFLRLGLTAFGGPAAHIAMMQDEVVQRRKWLTKEEFLDLLGACNLIPGPSSTELAIHIGFRLARWRGLVLAGICFILPAFLMVMGIAWAYVRFGHLPQAAGLLSGVKPVVIAVILQALVGLGRTALKNRYLMAVGVLTAIAAFLHVVPLLILVSGGGLAVGRACAAGNQTRTPGTLLLLIGLIAALVAFTLVLSHYSVPSHAVSTGALFWVFLKLGSVVYGSGYVLLAFIRTDLVMRLHWLTSAQIVDAVAVGQVTPGPVFTTATFIGFVLGGPMGATIATLGIFLPAFVFVAISGRLVTSVRRSPIARAFLDGVNAASLALMAAVTWDLGRAAMVDWISGTLALISAFLLLRFRVNSLWLILGGAIVGIAAFR